MALPHILVVDDDPDLLEMICLLLEQAGMEAECIGDAQQLYHKLQARRPRLVLMDIYLGAADGRELCLQLKNDPLYSAIPIILYSAGHITHTSIQQSKTDDFIAKPFDIEKLMTKIHVLLKV